MKAAASADSGPPSSVGAYESIALQGRPWRRVHVLEDPPQPDLDRPRGPRRSRRRRCTQRQRLQIKPSAAKEIEALLKKDRSRVVARIQELATNPSPPACEKLSGHELYRVRQGNDHVLYVIHDADLLVVVIKIGHRREVYR
jgi:mRNA interferase RelE/StbE